MSDFEQTIRALARRRPSMGLAEAIHQVDQKGSTLTISLEGEDVATIAEWIAGQPDIVAFCGIENPAMAQKINAIKEVRARTYIGLKEAKDAVEYFIAHHEELTGLRGEELERAAKEAVQSILATRDVTRDA